MVKVVFHKDCIRQECQVVSIIGYKESVSVLYLNVHSLQQIYIISTALYAQYTTSPVGIGSTYSS